MTRTHCLSLSIWVLTVCAATGGVLAQSAPVPSATPAPEATTPEREILTQRAALAKEIAESKAQIEAATASGDAAAVQELTTQLELLEKIDRRYGLQLAALQQETEIIQERQEIESTLAKQRVSGPAEAPPYSLVLLDRLQGELDALQGRKETVEAAMQAAEEALNQARDLHEEHERARRQARDAVETNSDPSAVGSLQRRLRTRQLESRAAAELVRLRERELANEKQLYDLEQQKAVLLREKIGWLQGRVGFSSQDLAEVLAQVEKRELDLRNALDKAEQELASAERQWSAAQRRLDAALEPNPALSEEVEAHHLARQASQRAVTVLGKQLERLTNAKTLWNRRYQTLNDHASRAELATWQQETTQALEELEREQRLESGRIAELRRTLTTLQAKLEDAHAANAPTVKWLREQERALQKLIGVYEADLTSLDTARQLHQRLLKEIQTHSETVSLAERLQTLLEAALAVWRYELIAVEDQPLTVRTVVAALLLLVLGILFSRYLSSLFGQRLLPRLGLEPGAATAFQTLAFYFLVVFFTLLALRTLNMPLTLFTFLGGALAIGVGFGSQNILNNFISGLILLAERPIRIGDMVDVDGTYGAVENIGLRSTRVRLFNNIHIIVPNSAFLEKNVINWTLSDDLVRVYVSVGVVYGSPTREVARLIRKAIDEHEKVLKLPEPIVLFTEFGDNSLNFEVHFWIRMKRLMDRRRIESDIRYRIDDLFREAGIVIAFPQRDVHLDTVKPLEVHLLGSPGDEAAEAHRRRHTVSGDGS